MGICREKPFDIYLEVEWRFLLRGESLHITDQGTHLIECYPVISVVRSAFCGLSFRDYNFFPKVGIEPLESVNTTYYFLRFIL